jgi:DNA replication protein DnaC
MPLRVCHSQVTEARFPRIKRLGDFDVMATPNVGAETIAVLASCAYLERGEPVVLLGDSGTGKSHLLIGMGWPPASLANGFAM